jgi:hypothetical protein
MKKIATLLSFVPVLASAQSLVHNTPEKRTALLEEFTGIHCGYCPEGHAIAASLEATLKDRFVTIGVHAGGYAVPAAGEPDFRTDDGTAIDAQFTVSGYPAATVNRHLVDGADDLGRGLWEGAVNDILTMPSPVNVGVESSFNETTRELTIHAVAYYTAASASGNDYLSVALKEDHIIGYQADYTNGTHTDYDHVAVLRDHITETWGEDVGSPAAGETVERTYTYTVPEEWVIGNCKVVAFIGEYQEEVYQAREVAAVSGTTLVIGSLSGDPQPYRPGTSGTVTGYVNGFSNAMGSDQDFVVSLVDTYAPYGWDKSFTVNGYTYTDPFTTSVASAGQLDVAVSITPNGNAGISHYELRIASASTPNAPVLVQPFHVISGVHDLIVTNPQAEAHEGLYWDGLWAEGAKGFTTRADYLEFVAANALTDVNNLYLNISWTFPSYTDEVANALASFMDNGGNLMIAGQDIGWDQSGQTGAYGTPVTQAFYENYLHATFQADGSSFNGTVDFDDTDGIFGGLSSIDISYPFGAASSYPDHFAPIPPAVPIMRYTPDSVAGLRAETGTYKLVYFGIGPEQVTDENVAHAMVQLSHDWFYGAVSVEEFDAAMANLGQPYPSPASDVLNINVAGVENASILEVVDASGRLVLSQGIGNNAVLASLDVTSLNNGVYSVRARGTNGLGQARVFEVLR